MLKMNNGPHNHEGRSHGRHARSVAAEACTNMPSVAINVDMTAVTALSKDERMWISPLTSSDKRGLIVRPSSECRV